MVKQTKKVGFITHLEDFFLYDERQRWKAIGWIVSIAGVFGSVELSFLHVSIDDCIFSVSIIILLISVAWIGWYCSFKNFENLKLSSSKRSILTQVAFATVAVFLGVSIFRIQQATSERKLQRIAIGPIDPASIGETQALLMKAMDAHVRIAPSLVESMGKRFIDASSQNPSAWNAALQFVNYRSSLNSSFPSLPDTTNEPAFRDKYVINIPTGEERPKFSLKGFVSANRAAQTGYIGEDRNEGLTSGPAWIVMEGGEVGLDGIQLRNVILHNVEVSYYGGPVIMQNVYFVNCTFKMTIHRQTQNLALALLYSPSAMSFESPLPADHSGI